MCRCFLGDFFVFIQLDEQLPYFKLALNMGECNQLRKLFSLVRFVVYSLMVKLQYKPAKIERIDHRTTATSFDNPYKINCFSYQLAVRIPYRTQLHFLNNLEISIQLLRF